MLEFNFTPFPELNTERLHLRQINRDDVQELYFLRSDEQVMQYIDRPRATTTAEVYQFIDMISKAIKENRDITWGICLKNESRIVGYLGWWRIKPEHHRAEIGYALHPAWHGKGVAGEAVKAVLDYGFTTMKLHSAEACVNPGNTASIKLLERNGFVREAYYKEDYYFNGRFLDSAIYSLLTPLV